MDKFLIIGGATKSGTTSLFNYLADHPEVCSADFKETRYFLNKDYPLKRMGFDGNYSRQDYIQLFNCDKQKSVRLEGTPDYLYSDNTAKFIGNTLKKDELKIIFILRNPVDRFISWYKFAIQDGKIDKSTTLMEYFEANKSADYTTAPLYLRVLKQGLYSNYLPSYFNTFGKENIKIAYFADFIKQTNVVLQEIASFTGIDSSFYQQYEAKHYNKSVFYKYPKMHGFYKKLGRTLRETFRNKVLRKILKRIKKHVDNLYLKINRETKNSNEFNLNSSSLKALKEYYFQEIKMFKNRSYEK